MSFFSIVCVLILEQLKALPARFSQAWQTAFPALLERQFNGGQYRHGMTAWALGAALPAMLALLLDWWLWYVQGLLSFLFGVLVLYLMVGFRQFSHYFTDIQAALRVDDIERARTLLAAWRGADAMRLGSDEIARVAIEQGILYSQRNVFAPFFWFVLLGPAGVMLYRLSAVLAERWRVPLEMQAAEGGAFGLFAGKAFRALDWLPARLTAMTFAIVGDFEDAVYCWRTQAALWPDTAAGILLSSGGGALGVRLGMPLPEALEVESRPELGLGVDVEAEHMQSAIGLVWRALILCLLLLALLTIANWVGN